MDFGLHESTLTCKKKQKKKSRPTAQLRRTELSCLSKLHMSYSHMHDPMYENEVKFYRTHICISDTVYKEGSLLTLFFETLEKQPCKQKTV